MKAYISIDSENQYFISNYAPKLAEPVEININPIKYYFFRLIEEIYLKLHKHLQDLYQKEL